MEAINAANKRASGEARYLQSAGGKTIIAEFDRIIAKEGDGEGIAHIIRILNHFDEATGRKHAAILMDHLPQRLLKDLAMAFVANHVIHWNYLKSLCILGYGNLGGSVIFDQLRHGVEKQTHMEDYLAFLDDDEVREFLSLAVVMLAKSPAEACRMLQENDCFPDDYLSGENVDEILTPANVVKLVVKVCFIRGMEVPSEVKAIRIREFFAFLCEEFKKKNVHPSDFLSMTRVAVKRYQLDIDVAIDYFKDHIIEAATCLAKDSGRPLPVPSPGSAAGRSFSNPPCDESHARTGHGLSDVGQSYLLSPSSLEIFSLELQNSECIAMMHHEPPMLIPSPSAMDLLSIRTGNQFFHVLCDQCPTYAQHAVNMLRTYEGVIYTRNPQRLKKLLHSKYGWMPDVVDIGEHMQQKLRRPSNFSDLSILLYDAKTCWRGKTFSAHVRPSRTAIKHREMVLTFVYLYGAQRVRAHLTDSGRTEEEERAEALILEEEARYAEMQRQRKEAEEERRRREDDLAENERRLQEKRRLREEEIAEEERQLADQQRVLEDQRRLLADDREREREREKQMEDLRHPRDRYHAMDSHEGKGKRSGRTSRQSADRHHDDSKRSRR